MCVCPIVFLSIDIISYPILLLLYPITHQISHSFHSSSRLTHHIECIIYYFISKYLGGLYCLLFSHNHELCLYQAVHPISHPKYQFLPKNNRQQAIETDRGFYSMALWSTYNHSQTMMGATIMSQNNSNLRWCWNVDSESLTPHTIFTKNDRPRVNTKLGGI